MLLMRVPGSVAPKRGDSEGEPLLQRETRLSPACPIPARGSGHSPGHKETSAHVPQGHVLRGGQDSPLSFVFASPGFEVMPGFWEGDQGTSLCILVPVLGCCRGELWWAPNTALLLEGL